MSLASRLAGLLAPVVLAITLAACAGQSLPPPAASQAAASDAGSQAQKLAAGTYSTQNFRPTLTFTVPDGWELVADTPVWVQLRPQGQPDLGLYLFRDARAASQDATCPTTPAEGVGMGSVELTTWFRGLPGVVAGTPALTTVGGLRGSSIDLGIKPGWTQSCPFADGVPTVPLIMNSGIDRWVLAGDETLRFYVLDLPDGGNVVVDVDDFAGTQIDALLKDAATVIKTFQFADDAGSSSAAPASPAAASPAASPAPSASTAP